MLGVGEWVRVYQHEAGQPARRDRRAGAFDVALGDVSDEQNSCCRDRPGFDLTKQLKIADGGSFIVTAAYVVSIRIWNHLIGAVP